MKTKIKATIYRVMYPFTNTKAFGQNESDVAKGGWSIAVTIAMIIAGLVIVTAAAVGISGASGKLNDTFTKINGLFKP